MNKEYKYWYDEKKEGIISDVAIATHGSAKAFLFELERILEENNLSQRQIEKYSKSKGFPVYQPFLSRLARGEVKSLNMTQFLSLLICLSELTGKDVQPHDVIRVVKVEKP